MHPAGDSRVHPLPDDRLVCRSRCTRGRQGSGLSYRARLPRVRRRGSCDIYIMYTVYYKNIIYYVVYVTGCRRSSVRLSPSYRALGSRRDAGQYYVRRLGGSARDSTSVSVWQRGRAPRHNVSDQISYYFISAVTDIKFMSSHI